AARNPSPPAAASGAAAQPPAGADARAKLEVLDAILASKNDNDPRLDSDFNDLSPDAKALLRWKYARLPPEERNERGTIVYLLGRGRNLSSPEDWAFLRSVAGEPACLSLADCSRRPRPGDGEDEDVGDAVTLAYPALVALKQAEGALARAGNAPGSAAVRREALSVFDAGAASRAPAAARLALRLRRRWAAARG
ncbi:MAG: hypothetical protein KGM24_09185, partial [Elusimicrobia bacterium]|nr:hypothetical protein [Elusimicrobiota bacterium]